MTANPDLGELERRPLKYWNVDGIPELLMGVLWIVWGGAFVFGNALPKGAAYSMYWMIIPVVLVLSGFAMNRVVKILKERITYPRAGWVEMREPSKAARFGAAGIAVLSAAAVAALVVSGKEQGVEDAMTPVTALLVSLAFVVASLRQRAPHYLALAGVALALGFAFMRLRMGYDGLSWMFVWLGVAAVVVGGIRLARFVKKNPRSTEAA